MNTAVDSKVSETVALAADYGFTASVETIVDGYVIIRIASNLKVKVMQTEAGNAAVSTWERKHKILNSSLAPKLAHYKAIADRRAARVA
jgi:hypothetical protein